MPALNPAVVYLDADALVVRNMDEAFGCAGFCAALRHSERLNSGVMVVRPSAAVFDDMLSKIGQLPSYTGCVVNDLGHRGPHLPLRARASCGQNRRLPPTQGA